MAVRALIFQATQRFAEAYRDKFQLDRMDFLCLELQINILEDLFPLFSSTSFHVISGLPS